MKTLRREQAKLGGKADLSPSEKFDAFMDFQQQQYVGLEERQKQIVDLIRKNPGIKNTEIAERLGITPTRVGQVRRTLGKGTQK